MSFTRFPEPGLDDSGLTSTAGAVAAWGVVAGAVAGVPAVVRTAAITSTERTVGVAVAALAVAAALVAARRDATWRGGRPDVPAQRPRLDSQFGPAPRFGAVSVVAVAVVVTAIGLQAWWGGRTVGVLATMGTVAAATVVVPVRRGRVAPTARIAAVVLAPTVATAWLARPVEATVAPLAAAAGTVALAVLVAAFPQRASSAVHAVDGVVAAAIGLLVRLLFGVLGLFVVVVPWVLDRLTGWDPLDPARRRGWVPVTADPWAGPGRGGRRPAGGARVRRGARRLLGTAVVVALLGVVALGAARAWYRDPGDVLDAPAMASSPWWPEYVRALEQVRGRLRLDSFVGYELPDVRSAHIDIVDGRRATWRPPAVPGCEPVRVWMFGGSTMFGEGQRDDHTIPSELARRAAAAGRSIEVENFGVFGDTAWIEARRLEVALAELPAPNLVVFYDGINEYEVRRQLSDEGRPADAYAVSYLDTGLSPVTDLRGAVEDLLDPPTDVTVVDAPARRLDPAELGRLMTRQYAASVAAARRLLDERGVPGRFFLQPTIYSRAVAVPGEPSPDAPRLADARESFAVLRRSLPDGVVDLSDVLDGLRRPTYRDSSHTNEEGAARVADALWAELAPDLRARAATDCGEGACC